MLLFQYFVHLVLSETDSGRLFQRDVALCSTRMKEHLADIQHKRDTFLAGHFSANGVMICMYVAVHSEQYSHKPEHAVGAKTIASHRTVDSYLSW